MFLLKLPAHGKQSELHLLQVWAVLRDQLYRSLHNMFCVNKNYKFKQMKNAMSTYFKTIYLWKFPHSQL